MWVRYVRYADDFVIALMGSKKDALTLKKALRGYLKDYLKLTLREEKTLITKGKNPFYFLGFKVFVNKNKGKFGLHATKYGLPIPNNLGVVVCPDLKSIFFNLRERGIVKKAKHEPKGHVGCCQNRLVNNDHNFIVKKFNEV